MNKRDVVRFDLDAVYFGDDWGQQRGLQMGPKLWRRCGAPLGVSCFNPFQPEVMDVWSLLPRYRGRLAFHGGLSTQRTLPFGSVDEVRAEVGRLLEMGREGGYIFAPAHDVEGDVPLENLLAAIEAVQSQIA